MNLTRKDACRCIVCVTGNQPVSGIFDTSIYTIVYGINEIDKDDEL